MKAFVYSLLFLGWQLTIPLTELKAQSMSLEEVVQFAKEQSVAGKRAFTQKKTNFWQYKYFLSDFRPQLSLDGSLPNFTRSSIAVTQPDGTINFQQIANNNSVLNLSLSQNIAFTGGTIFLQKQLQRFDNFQQNTTLYNGIPLSIGINQPLFRYNAMKWSRKIEPLKYAEGNQQWIESLEQVALSATGLYFDLLVAQVNLQIARKNLQTNDTLYKIAVEKLRLGKLSQNDLLQLQLSVVNARKELASSEQNAAVASLLLKSFIGYRDERLLDLVVPSDIRPFDVNIQTALNEAFANRPAAIAFRRTLLEAERDVNKARKDNGLNASLSAALGLSNSGAQIHDVYYHPKDREYVEMQFTMPIMTWGRARARTETALANQQLAAQSVEQNKLTFEQEVYTQVTLLHMLQKQVTLTIEADQIAASRYQIAQDRFKLSNMSVTDLGIATQEKDRAKRDAILALREYWQAYYTLRLLTLYDFERQEKISY